MQKMMKANYTSTKQRHAFVTLFFLALLCCTSLLYAPPFLSRTLGLSLGRQSKDKNDDRITKKDKEKSNRKDNGTGKTVAKSNNSTKNNRSVNTSSSASSSSSSRVSLWRQEAKRQLATLDFDTLLTSRTSVLTKESFPRNWRPCVVEELLLSQKGNQTTATTSSASSLNITIVGGSSSARPGRNCSEEQYGGRYGNILEKQLNQAGIPTTVVNMAQGAVGTTYASQLLDRLVDAEETNLILWEFALNDFQRDPTQAARRLQFFFARIESLYYHQNKPPPPILLLYLWETYAGKLPNKQLRKRGLGSSILNNYTWNLIDRYRDQYQWDIQVLHVGPSINRTGFIKHKTYLFDDVHHPSCKGVHLVANMIQYAMFQNLASLSPSVSSCRRKFTATSISGSSRDALAAKSLSSAALLSRKQLEKLTLDQLLLRPEIQMGSFSLYEPQLGQSTALNIVDHKTTNQQYFGTLFPEKVSDERTDRKHVYKMPSCLSPTPNWLTFTITLEDPTQTLAWLAFKYKGREVAQVAINDVIIPIPPKRAFTSQWTEKVTSSWIPLPSLPDHAAYYLQNHNHDKNATANRNSSTNATTGTTTTISLCHNRSSTSITEKTAWLEHMLVVSLPSPRVK